MIQKLESGLSPLILKDELGDPHFWDYYVSMDSQNAPLMDVFRVIQKLSQYCQIDNGSLKFDEMHSTFAKMIKLTKSVKSLFLRENQHMLTRELYEKSIQDLMANHKVVEG